MCNQVLILNINNVEDKTEIDMKQPRLPVGTEFSNSEELLSAMMSSKTNIKNHEAATRKKAEYAIRLGYADEKDIPLITVI